MGIARPHDFIHPPTPLNKILLRDPVRLQQELNGKIDAVVDRDRDVHLRLFLDQLFHSTNAELRRNRDDQTIPRWKNRQRAQRIFSPERPSTVISHRRNDRRIEPDKIEFSGPYKFGAIQAATPGRADANGEWIRWTGMR